MLLLLILCVANALTVYDDLSQLPRKEFTNWTHISMEDHSNRQPNQAPSEWTNLTFYIPDYTCSVQTTAKYFNNYSILTEETIYYAVSYWDYTFHTSIVWWYKPWILSIGWALC